jgi:hypothetical protein
VWDGDISSSALLPYRSGRSKPTVWDGDVNGTPPPPPYRMVLSPPCGMETHHARVYKLVKPVVLSPPCGMETRHIWLSAWTWPCVLSPPCGMETQGHRDFERLKRERNGSKPTVWDGDSFSKRLRRWIAIGSKPTVWDGDLGGGVEACLRRKVLSPPCGMETSVLPCPIHPPDSLCSKPTVWDGDQKRASASPFLRASRF